MRKGTSWLALEYISYLHFASAYWTSALVRAWRVHTQQFATRAGLCFALVNVLADFVRFPPVSLNSAFI